MKRDLEMNLQRWKNSRNRKPLLLRGARQVGKSFVVRQFGQRFPNYVEANFELNPQLSMLFEKDLQPSRIVRDISILLKEEIIPGQTLLFLDEIQECPRAITALRYFYELMPELHVIAAGSLIDFTLEKIGVPVGRVTFLNLYPMSFLEFLSASDNGFLRQAIETQNDFPQPIHDRALALLGEYTAVGGMPEALRTWIETQNLKLCSEVHKSLVDTYRQDFSKYARTKQQPHVEAVFSAVPRLLGQKFVYQSVTPEARSRALRPALELLTKAQVVHQVFHSSANGVPLNSEVNPERFKTIFLDIALAQTLLNAELGPWVLNPSATMANRGPITEAFVGQELLAYSEPDQPSELHYWARESRGSQAEVDYVIASQQTIVPIEVKSGTTGSTKSLRVFLEHKNNSPYGVKVTKGHLKIESPIRQYPLYAICRLRRSSSI